VKKRLMEGRAAHREVMADERKKRAKAAVEERKLREAKKRAAEEYEGERGACWGVGARCRRGAGCHRARRISSSSVIQTPSQSKKLYRQVLTDCKSLL
jgi:hypothetical protein